MSWSVFCPKSVAILCSSRPSQQPHSCQHQVQPLSARTLPFLHSELHHVCSYLTFIEFSQESRCTLPSLVDSTILLLHVEQMATLPLDSSAVFHASACFAPKLIELIDVFHTCCNRSIVAIFFDVVVTFDHFMRAAF